MNLMGCEMLFYWRSHQVKLAEEFYNNLIQIQYLGAVSAIGSNLHQAKIYFAAQGETKLEYSAFLN